MAEHKYPGTQKSYYADLKRTAKYVIEEAKGRSDDHEEALNDVIREYADNAVIYTYRVREIITWTDNLDAYEEEMGDVEGGTVHDVLTRIAYFAYQADLREAIDRLAQERARGRAKREYYGAEGNPRKKGAKKAAKKRAKKPAKKNPSLSKLLRS